LEFTNLSDLENKLAREFGVDFGMPGSWRPVFETFGHGLVARNGDHLFEAPVPVTLLVDEKGTARVTYVYPDYSKRFNQSMALEFLKNK
jgi:peroxiredoxin